MQKPWMVRSAFTICLVAVLACGGSEGEAGDALEAAVEDLKKSGEDLAGEVENIVVGAGDVLQGTIDEIKAAIAEKEDELQAISEKLAKMSPDDLMAAEVAKLKQQSEALAERIQGLKDNLEAAIHG